MHNRVSALKMAFESKIAFKLSPTQNKELSEQVIFSLMQFAAFDISMLLSRNSALRIYLSCQELGVLLQLRMFFESYYKTIPEALKKCVCKSILKADLVLDNSLSVIASMDCFDVPKSMLNIFLGPSEIFFPTVSINYMNIL